MIKTGRVEKGKTPSELSGKPSDKIRGGIPLAREEKAPLKTLEKLASQIEVDSLKVKR